MPVILPLTRRGVRPAKLKLICFPHAGGDGGFYRQWAALLGDRVDVMIAVLPGRGINYCARTWTEFDVAVEALVAEVISFNHHRVGLFGHSLGALLAFEVARKMRTVASAAQPLLLGVSGCPAPTNHRDTGLSRLSDMELTQWLQGEKTGAQLTLTSAELIEVALPAIRADLGLYDSYHFVPSELLDCPILCLAGDSDPQAPAELMAGWAGQTKGKFTSHVYSGDHFFLVHSPEGVITALAEALEDTSKRKMPGERSNV